MIRAVWADWCCSRLKSCRLQNIKLFAQLFEFIALMFIMLDWLRTDILDMYLSQPSMCLCETAVRSRAITGCVVLVSPHVQQLDEAIWGLERLLYVLTDWRLRQTFRLSYSLNHTRRTHMHHICSPEQHTDGFPLFKVINNPTILGCLWPKYWKSFEWILPVRGLTNAEIWSVFQHKLKARLLQPNTVN